MSEGENPNTIRENAAAYREKREKGLRPIQIWVPDVRSPEFQREAHRQSAEVAGSRLAEDDQAFIDAVSDLDGE